ncbi:MAG: RNA-binding S4 domain-containing protein [Myxococcales bacterium]|nr:RNA-binding S4 domain-containing protein [Myxococcales bacterium]
MQSPYGRVRPSTNSTSRPDAAAPRSVVLCDIEAVVRIDKWLCAARFYKTRTLAASEMKLGRVLVNGERVKASKQVKVGDEICIYKGSYEWTVDVLALAEKRLSAEKAQELYEEQADSIALREATAVALKEEHESQKWAQRHGRPTKKERRDMQKFRGKG